MRHVTLAFLLTVPALAGATEYAGGVVSVHDGDTLRVLYRDGELKVRLDCIDAPDLRQTMASARNRLTSPWYSGAPSGWRDADATGIAAYLEGRTTGTWM
jgi:endonuclease YncB( thermonuclease family)